MAKQQLTRVLETKGFKSAVHGLANTWWPSDCQCLACQAIRLVAVECIPGDALHQNCGCAELLGEGKWLNLS